MIADLPIYRRDDVRGEYYVVFDKESIFKIAKKWARGKGIADAYLVLRLGDVFGG